MSVFRKNIGVLKIKTFLYILLQIEVDYHVMLYTNYIFIDSFIKFLFLF